jgi:hypothetical protein
MAEQTLMERLAEPFDAKEIKFKPQIVRSNRALAICYVDARVIMDRLDHVFGIDGWQDEYEHLDNRSVVCRLRVKVDGEWIVKSDVGSISEQPDEGDRTKSAFSDSLKRAAVKYGIGRYLYRLPQQWVDYDAQTRQIKSPPTLPAWAKPAAKQKPDAPYQDATPAEPKPAKKDGANITKDQWQQIKANLVRAGVPQGRFLSLYKLEKAGDLPAEKFADALKWSEGLQIAEPQGAAP